MNIAIIGTGYVGLVTGSCFASSGTNVIGVDKDKNKVKGLLEGKVPFYEPGLGDLVRTNIAEGRLHFTSDISDAVEKSLIVFIAVGTPPNSDGSADVGLVLDVARSIAEFMNEYKIIVTKSTVPVGTTEMVRKMIRENTDKEFDVASNPEFLKEGSAVEDFLKPDRVVIGIDKASVGNTLKELYSPFMRSADRAIVVSIRSAELSKYTANAMLATRISFMNEIANLCELVGADISEVRHVIGADHRIGRHFLFPGIGYGGSCFPKDVKALIRTAQDRDFELKICKATDEVNASQKTLFWRKIEGYFGGGFKDKRIGVWGLSFKPRTDDLREAPSIYFIEKLLSKGAEITVHDPVAIKNAKISFGKKLKYAESNYDACHGADALIIHTEWNEYRQPDFERVKKLMRSPVIFDGRNLYNSKTMKKLGFSYFAVGINDFENIKLDNSKESVNSKRTNKVSRKTY
ncbi:UDP-glucose/GDP-mannose dehydrogenase family protein [Desulfobacterota bacterium AH_259_B03_O07]|nr:UDP-glucose/GDP-mannose dehydrogenase family protein [Desulfobacterota bacterium AH_259_B03_O07]